MNVIIPSVFLIVLGAVIYVVGPKTAKPGAAGSTKLAGLGAMIGGLVLMVSSVLLGYVLRMRDEFSARG